MPVVFTFDIQGPALIGTQSIQNRVQCAFQRLGWQHLGGTAYRYPSLDSAHPTEDWMNHVVPALMLFRTMVRRHNVQVTKFTIDVQSSTGHDSTSNVGSPAEDGAAIELYDPNHPNHFGDQNLKDWIDGIVSPYP